MNEEKPTPPPQAPPLQSRKVLEQVLAVVNDGQEAIKRGHFEGRDARTIASFQEWLRKFISNIQVEVEKLPMDTPMPGWAPVNPVPPNAGGSA